MKEIVDYLASAQVANLASDPRVLFAAAVLFIVAVLMRWKSVFLLMFGVGGIMTVVRYTNAGGGGASLDRNLVVFAVGSFVVGVVLIYFLFIKGD